MRILCLLALLLTVSCQKKQATERPPAQVRVTKPTIKDVEIFKSYVGHVQPYLQVEVKSQVEGVLTGYYFQEGQEVKQGDLIFTIDSRPFQAQLSKAEGALAESIANLRYAEDVAKRNAKLAQEDFVSQVQYDEYITNVITNKAEIKQNEADIETAKINISYCNIHAPMNSVTGIIKLQVGNLIKNAEDTPLVTLNQITPTYAYFSVPQKDLPEIMSLHRKETLKVKAFLNGNYKTPYEGTLNVIDNEVNDQTGSIWLRGIFPNEEKMLWPGEFIDVHLITGEKKNAILVPTESISLGQKGKYMFVIHGESIAELRYVKTGQRVGEMTIIEQGIQPEDTIVIEGQINLGNATKVKINTQGKSS